MILELLTFVVLSFIGDSREHVEDGAFEGGEDLPAPRTAVPGDERALAVCPEPATGSEVVPELTSADGSVPVGAGLGRVVLGACGEPPAFRREWRDLDGKGVEWPVPFVRRVHRHGMSPPAAANLDRPAAPISRGFLEGA